MKSLGARSLFVLAVAIAGTAFAFSASAVSVDLTSGTTGSFLLNQSFNGETRAADVTLLGGDDQIISSMAVAGVDIRDDSTLVGARIYDSNTGTAIGAGAILVAPGEDQTITVPIAGTLAAGGTYRLAFFVPSSSTGNNGDLFDPDPPSGGGFGYVESQGLFQVNGGYQLTGDSFPTTPSFSTIARISLVAEPAPPVSVQSSTWSKMKYVYQER